MVGLRTDMLPSGACDRPLHCVFERTCVLVLVELLGGCGVVWGGYGVGVGVRQPVGRVSDPPFCHTT